MKLVKEGTKEMTINMDTSAIDLVADISMLMNDAPGGMSPEQTHKGKFSEGIICWYGEDSKGRSLNITMYFDGKKIEYSHHHTRENYLRLTGIAKHAGWAIEENWVEEE